MSDLISMEQLVTELEIEICETYNDDIIKGIRRAIEIVESRPIVATPLSDCVGDCKSCWKTKLVNAPTVEPVRGEWKADCDLYFSTCRCSECNTLALKRYNFCPNCGADMRGEKNDC